MKLPQPRKIIAEKYVAGLSLFKSRRSPIKLSANESALGPSPKAVKSYSSVGKGFVRSVSYTHLTLPTTPYV